MTIEPGAATAVRAPRPEKVAVVEDVRSRLSASSAAILTEYRGLHVSHMAELRRALAPIGGSYKVYKNTLVRRAAEETGFGALSALLEGPTAIAFVDGDVAAVAKVLREFSRTHPALVVKGGLIGTSLLDSRGAQALADLPSREVLLAQIAGALAAPMQKFAALLAAVPQKMAYGLKALIDARVAAGEAPPPVAASPAPEEVAASAVTGGEAAPPAAAPTEDVAAEETVPAETSSAEETVPA
ncbi:MAG TPA: 50S ribosomal protein L10, partial [Acidimicrobiales bacterium]|nr:50S ribosomal protein L10 [Acidimicrobiales bacterium]